MRARKRFLTRYFFALFERANSWGKWPAEHKSETIGNVQRYFEGADYPEYLQQALCQALVKAANVYCPGLDPDLLT